MSFYIVRTDGTVLTIINDGELNTDSTSLYLPGRNYPGYGSVIDTNFVRQLENFAFVNPPANALRGQLWFNTDNDSLYVCPSDGETNPNNWYKLFRVDDPNADIIANSLQLSGDIWANNAHIANTVNANLVDTDYLTVNIQANIANANVTGNTALANLNTSNITTGSNTTPGTLTGAWVVDGSIQTTGNVSAGIFQSDSYRYANGAVINFDAANGSTGYVQFATNGSLDSSPDLIFNRNNSTLFVANAISVGVDITSPTFTGSGIKLTNLPAGNLEGVITPSVQSSITQLGVLSSLTVTGNINTSNVSATNIVSNTLRGSLTTNAQPNITSVGTLNSLSVTNNIVAGNVYANSGTLQGNLLTGTLTTSAQPNITSVGTLSSLIVSGNASFGNVSGGNLVTSNYLSGVLTTASQPNITSVGTLSSLVVSGTISGATISGTHTGNGAGLSSINGANVTGTVANAAYAINSGSAVTAETVTSSAQPNITSVGVLNSLAVTGNLNSGNISASNISGNHIGDGSRLTNINGANVFGQVANAAYADNANYASYAGDVINSSQPNITTVGTLNSLTVSGNLTAATATVLGNTNFSTGTQQVRDIIEQVSVSASAISGTVVVDLIGPPTKYYTANSAGNWTFNFRGNSSVTTNSYLQVGRSATVTILVKQGGTAYYPTAFNIDGVQVVPKWVGGLPPTAGNPGSINSYTFTIIKTASTPTYTVLASALAYSDTPPLPTSTTRTCIAVIDECSQTTTTMQNSWNSFRTSYPDRPFYLLQPEATANPTILKIPSEFYSNPLSFYSRVNRDNGSASQASDWYSICKIDSLPDGSSVALWIDNSGSMTNATVQASINLFNSKIAQRNITYTVMTGSDENWVQPFNKVIN